MWQNIKFKKPKDGEHVYVWNGHGKQLMMWRDNMFIPPKHEWHRGIDGKYSFGFVDSSYEIWFDVQDPSITDLIECQ